MTNVKNIYRVILRLLTNSFFVAGNQHFEYSNDDKKYMFS